MLNRRDVIKNFTIGFLPLLIFIVADELFGLTTGLIVAVGFGIFQSVASYIKNKRIEGFILFDTLLILVLGFVSLLLQNDIFFKIKPGLIGLILIVLLGIMSFASRSWIIRFTGHYLKNIDLSEEQLDMMRGMMKRLFFLFSLHTFLIFYAAFYMSKEAWAFISGGLFYILMAVVFGFEFLNAYWKKIQMKRQFSQEEWFDIVSPQGKIIGKAPRSAVHGNPELIHPVVHVHIINSSGQILLQKRSEEKDIQPGKWDTAIGGHVISGETIERALKREAEEELGISMGKFHPLFRYLMKNEIESELVHGYLLREDGPFYPNRKEISEIRFWTADEIENHLGQDTFTPNFEKEFQLLNRLIFQKN